MAEELTERLRRLSEDSSEAADRARCRAFIEAADRIESLEAKLEKAREAMLDALGWHQVTHIHAALNQALKELSQ